MKNTLLPYFYYTSTGGFEVGEVPPVAGDWVRFGSVKNIKFVKNSLYLRIFF